MSKLQLHWLMVGGRVALILVIAVILIKGGHWLVSRLTDRHATRTPRRKKKTEAARRREQRARAVGSVANNTITIFVCGISFLLILGEVGLELGPILTSAGVLGIALGFGAQELVRDFMNGIAMIMEDQFGVGDEITIEHPDLGGITGIVEAVEFRITKIRDSDGAVWYARNGQIDRVRNESQRTE